MVNLSFSSLSAAFKGPEDWTERKSLNPRHSEVNSLMDNLHDVFWILIKIIVIKGGSSSKLTSTNER